MAAEEARFAALRKFGNVTLAKEMPLVWIPLWLDDVQRDFRYAAGFFVESHLRTDGGLIAGHGIGASTTVLRRPIPSSPDGAGVAEPIASSTSIEHRRDRRRADPVSQYLEIRERATLFDDVYAYGSTSPMSLMEETVQSGAGPVFASV